MYIVSANQSQVVDSAFVERFVLVEKPDAVILAASYNDTRLPVTLTKFCTMSEARNTLLDLANALAELERVAQKYETAVKLQVKMTEISNRQRAELEQAKRERDAHDCVIKD